MKHNIYDIIVRPLVTEKSTHVSERRNVYTFEVATDANKTQIKDAVEKIYDVKVTGVRTAMQKGKRRRYGRMMGKTRHWKKAFVELDEEHRIDLF
jgi:large subunit ribosomal protein L23